jgi:predicted dehydrogenase
LSRTYRAVVVGLGRRGKHHAAAFKGSSRFELAGISTRGAAHPAAFAMRKGLRQA